MLLLGKDAAERGRHYAGRMNRGRRTYRRRRATALTAVLMFTVLAVVVVFGSSGGRSISRPSKWLSAAPQIARERITIASAALHRRIDTAVLLPSGYKKQDRRPLLVLLHGRGTDQTHLYDAALLKALAALGAGAPIVALPYGGDHSYWHDRADGAWGRYVTDEVIPQVARRYGADRRRVAIGGVSMGGFGALDLARLHPGRFCAVGGHSPALWQTSGETAAGAFDDAADFARHDVIAAARTNPGVYSGTRIWLDAGDQDPFQPGFQALRTALRNSGAKLTAHTWPGGHAGVYTDAHYSNYLRFYRRALAACGRSGGV
jgi:S-formylglutathione hydrolase FrmB